ncbi:MAG: hypothetical protein ACI8SR_000779 [Oceanicoccus sp.]|jgi:hypothetical protein
MILNRVIMTSWLLVLVFDVYAWNFDEHSSAGRTAYLKACESLPSSLNDQQKQILNQWLCQSDFRLMEQADAYGRMSALAGDHLTSPKEFLSQEGEVAAGSAIVYASLAAENATHFWPMVQPVWVKHHLNALEVAKNIHARLIMLKSSVFKQSFTSQEKLELARLMKEMLAYSAFADHFLQDAFSIGHSGFGRAASSAELSVGFHDYYNKEGALLGNRKYGTWIAYGDGMYVDNKNTINQSHLLDANTQAIKNIFLEVLGVSSQAEVLFPSHTSNRFQPALIKFKDNTVTCHGLVSAGNNRTIYLGKGSKYQSEFNSEYIDREFKGEFFSNETPQDCLMPIDVIGAMPLRRVLSLDILLDSILEQNQDEAYGGWEVVLSADSLFDWKYTGLGAALSYKDVNDKGNLLGASLLATFPYQYGDLGAWRFNVGYGFYDIDIEIEDKTKEGLQLGMSYLVPIRIIPNSSIVLGVDYFCTEESRLRCDDNVSEFTFKAGISFAFATIGGGYNKNNLFD